MRPLCERCQKNLALKYYTSNGRYKKQYQRVCSSCRYPGGVVHRAKSYAANPDKWKNKNTKRLYGITLEEYRNLRDLQDHKCYVCDRVCEDRRFYLDHNHETGAIRKFLCPKCNMALSVLEDAEYLQKLQSYLEEHE